MVLILDGKKIGVREEFISFIVYLICLRHLFRSRSVTNLIDFLFKRPVFFHTFATYSELQYNIMQINHIISYVNI